MKRNNPWNEIELSDYENHMSDSNVGQLPMLNNIMKSQLSGFGVKSVCILGIAGGNGLEHIVPCGITEVLGVDINKNYLAACVRRYPQLENIFHPILCDLSLEVGSLPASELLIADLLVEYIGYERFNEAVQKVGPKYVSCVIQEDTDDSFVSPSEYAEKLEKLDSIHNSISRNGLKVSLNQIGYRQIKESVFMLPNFKKLVRLDFCN